jgi:hypothetical protein
VVLRPWWSLSLVVLRPPKGAIMPRYRTKHQGPRTTRDQVRTKAQEQGTKDRVKAAQPFTPRTVTVGKKRATSRALSRETSASANSVSSCTIRAASAASICAA